MGKQTPHVFPQVVTRTSNGNTLPARPFANAQSVHSHPRFLGGHGKDLQPRSFRLTMDTTPNSEVMPNPMVPDPVVATLKLPEFWQSDSELVSKRRATLPTTPSNITNSPMASCQRLGEDYEVAPQLLRTLLLESSSLALSLNAQSS